MPFSGQNAGVVPISKNSKWSQARHQSATRVVLDSRQSLLSGKISTFGVLHTVLAQFVLGKRIFCKSAKMAIFQAIFCGDAQSLSADFSGTRGPFPGSIIFLHTRVSGLQCGNSEDHFYIACSIKWYSGLCANHTMSAVGSQILMRLDTLHPNLPDFEAACRDCIKIWVDSKN